jgi:hypothetical protein
MSHAPINARAHLLTLVGRPISAFRGKPMTVLEVHERTVVVRTPRAPAGTTIRIDWVQQGIDRLLREGDIPPTAEALGRRCEFIAAVLLTVPGAARSADSARIVLQRQAGTQPPGPRPQLTSLTELKDSTWPFILLASCAAVAMTTYGWTSSPARPLVTTWFLLLCPGMALVRFLPQRGPLTLFVLAIATSLSLETLVAETMLEASLWSPRATLAILIALTAGGAVAQLGAGRARGDRFAHPDASVAGLRSA